MPVSLKRPALGDTLLLYVDFADPTRGVLDEKQPFHGKVVYVHDSGRVNVAASNHRGQRVAVEEVEVYDADPSDKHSQELSGARGPFCVWPSV